MLRRKLLLLMLGVTVLLLALALAALLGLQGVLRQLDDMSSEAGSLVALAHQFRWIVLGIAVGFLLVLNASILLMFRVASMVLRPVDSLVAASRELAREHFEHRVEVDQNDEFAELASAFNRLAQQLQENEKDRMQTLGQVALTLNHELNNAIAIIDLQLNLLRRRSGQGEAIERCLTQIHTNLSRMTKVVDALKGCSPSLWHQAARVQ